MFDTGVDEPLRVYYRARSGGVIDNRDILSIFFNMKIYCVFSFESPQRSDSNEYTQYTISQYKKEIILNYPKSATMEFVPRDVRTISKQPW